MTGTNLDPSFALAQDIAGLKKRVAILESQDVLHNSSMSFGALGVRSGASLNVSGSGSIQISGGGSAYVNGVNIAQLSTVYSASTASGVIGGINGGGTFTWSSDTGGSRPSITLQSSTGKVWIRVSAVLFVATDVFCTVSVTGAVTGTKYIDRDAQRANGYGMSLTNTQFYLGTMELTMNYSTVFTAPIFEPVNIQFEYGAVGRGFVEWTTLIAEVVS